MTATIQWIAPLLSSLTMIFAVAARAEDGGTADKAEYCQECHGVSGQGYRGFFTMPRLAGQQPEYLENQLRAFAEHSRDNNIGINMAAVHGLSPAMRGQLATHFRGLNPTPLEVGPRNVAAAGETIYEAGLPESNVPACVACHGPGAKGQNGIPRLAGQLSPYTVKTLANWNKERHQSASAIMAPIARNLNQSQIASVAAYLNYLK
jgi:cytochrome c553